MKLKTVLKIFKTKFIEKAILGMTLRSKFIIFFFILVLVPFVSFGIITYSKSGEVIAESMALNKITQINSSLHTFLKSARDSLDSIYNDKDFSNYFYSLSRNSAHKIEYNIRSSFTDKIVQSMVKYKIENKNTQKTKSMVTQNDFSGIYFFNKLRVYSLLPEYVYLFSVDRFTKEKWYSNILTAENEYVIFSGKWQKDISSQYVNTISIARVIKNIDTEENIGILKFDISFDKLNSVINSSDANTNTYPGSNLFIVDSNNNIIYNKTFGSSPDPKYKNLFAKLHNSKGIISDVVDGTDVYIVYDTSQLTSWKTINIIPKAEISKNLLSIKNTFFYLTIISLVVVLLLSSTISSILLKPLKKLTEAMEKVEKGNFSARVNLKNQDETKYLADSFNKMTSNIEYLINKIYNSEIKQREAELNSLQNQINPHFLYNTLESIRGAALLNNVPSVAEMAKSLSLLFRYSIEQKIIVPFKDELDHLKNYVTIQNFRHDNKFEIKYNINDEIYNYYILKLVLQPIVENSIKHGLEMKLGKGVVEVSASVSENNIINIIISDDGIGIDPNKRDYLNNMLKESPSSDFKSNESKSASGTGIGVLNVNSRLKLQFGEQYGLMFLNTKVGTSVKLTFPVIGQADITKSDVFAKNSLM